MKRLLLLLAVLTMTACGTTATVSTASPKASSAPAPAPAPSKSSTYNLDIGATVDLSSGSTGDKWSVTVNSVKKYVSDNPYMKPDAGHIFIVADVTYSVKAGTANANPFDWEAKDPSGLVAPMAFATQTLPASTVEAPNNVRGTVVLQSPTGSGGTVIYSAGFAERASWTYTAAEVA